MNSPRWHQQTPPDVRAYELMALLAMVVLPVPTLVLLVWGIAVGSTGLLIASALLSLAALVLLSSATTLRIRARERQDNPAPEPERSPPAEQRRGSWPWA